MTDRELLELAANAAGIELLWRRGHPYRGANNVRQAEWNPLEDDGDALRLAVTLNRTDIGSLIMNYTSGSEYREDKFAATRRAITRAAAEIGRQMP